MQIVKITHSNAKCSILARNWNRLEVSKTNYEYEEETKKWRKQCQIIKVLLNLIFGLGLIWLLLIDLRIVAHIVVLIWKDFTANTTVKILSINFIFFATQAQPLHLAIGSFIKQFQGLKQR